MWKSVWEPTTMPPNTPDLSPVNANHTMQWIRQVSRWRAATRPPTPPCPRCPAHWRNEVRCRGLRWATVRVRPCWWRCRKRNRTIRRSCRVRWASRRSAPGIASRFGTSFGTRGANATCKSWVNLKNKLNQCIFWPLNWFVGFNLFSSFNHSNEMFTLWSTSVFSFWNTLV